MKPKTKTKKFIVSGELTISTWKEIEASSKEEAREKARELCTPTLCYGCAQQGHDDSNLWVVEELDGETIITRVEEKKNS